MALASAFPIAAQPTGRAPVPVGVVTKPASPARAFLQLGAGLQIGPRTFSETRHDIVNAEQQTLTTGYSLRQGVVLEGGGGWHVRGHLFAGATFAYFHEARPAQVTAQVPHPFFLNQPREVAGDSPSLSQDEHALHFSVLWMRRAGGRVDLGLLGGPSVMHLARQVVAGVAITEEYPYDVAAFSRAVLDRAAGTRFGFHVGAQAAWRVRPQLGVAATVRYTHGNGSLATPGGGSLEFAAGGLQALIGVRIARGTLAE